MQSKPTGGRKEVVFWLSRTSKNQNSRHSGSRYCTDMVSSFPLFLAFKRGTSDSTRNKNRACCFFGYTYDYFSQYKVQFLGIHFTFKFWREGRFYCRSYTWLLHTAVKLRVHILQDFEMFSRFCGAGWYLVKSMDNHWEYKSEFLFRHRTACWDITHL